jgi:hypothetical protein
VLPSSSSTCSDNFLSIALTSSSAPACRCSLKFCQPLHPNSQRPPSCMFRKLLFHYINIWVWVNTYRYIFSGMNIHLPAILGFTRYQGFDPSPYVKRCSSLFSCISPEICHRASLCRSKDRWPSMERFANLGRPWEW